MELVQPSAEYKDSFIEAVKEYKNEAETEPTRSYRNLSIQVLETDFESFVEQERSHAEGKNQEKGVRNHFARGIQRVGEMRPGIEISLC